jgi:uncharacterized protein
MPPRQTSETPAAVHAAPPSDPWAVEVHTQPSEIDAQAWNALLASCEQPTPFMRHEWLAALDDSGCAAPDTGWTPLWLTVQAPPDASLNATPGPHALAGACVVYVKTHSWGEYVFDWAWADAHKRAGQHYYPKLVCASPFTPVPGSRLLATCPEARQALLAALVAVARQVDASSVHVLFPDAPDLAAARKAGWLIRQGVQFHWLNRHVGHPSGPAAVGAEPYADWADFLASMQRDKRKKIQQERRRVADAGVTVRVLRGTEITLEDWDLFERCYRHTYLAHGNPPYLSAEFFHQVARTLPEHWLLFVAEREGRAIAASLLGIDAQQGAAWGRYWGALEHVPCLHFELCYYAPLQWCIEQRFARFEGGAQGEHKMARGLLPVTTYSAHWLKEPRFADAIARYLAQEGSHIEAYIDELRERQPFKPTSN